MIKRIVTGYQPAASAEYPLDRLAKDKRLE